MSVATVAPWPMGLYNASLDSSFSGTGDELRTALQIALEQPGSPKNERLVPIVVEALKKAEREGVLVRADAFGRALDLLAILPADIPLPEIVVETEHEVGLDWDVDAKHVVAVTVDETSFVGFAALLGTEPMHGRILFAGEAPQTLLYLLSRLFPDSGRSI